MKREKEELKLVSHDEFAVIQEAEDAAIGKTDKTAEVEIEKT